MKKQKYEEWTQYLCNCQDAACTLSFGEIKNILGFSLPNVATAHASAFWSNGNQNYALIWLRAGWIVSRYDLNRQQVLFVRDAVEANQYIAKCNGSGSDSIRKRRTALPIICTPKIDCSDMIGFAQKYFNVTCQDKHARYLSWDHCYSFFQKNRQNPSEVQKDFLCLHLAWYLASWGMLRGGSFLLQKDYLIHMPVVELLTSNQYTNLYQLTAIDYSNVAIVNEICQLGEQIRAIYQKETGDDQDTGKIASDTLVTKILLGTIGCTPAYDRYFKSGLSISSVSQQRFGKSSLLQLGDYYARHIQQFEAFRESISLGRINYTPMKVIDMCFWQLGYDNDVQNEKEEE